MNFQRFFMGMMIILLFTFSSFRSYSQSTADDTTNTDFINYLATLPTLDTFNLAKIDSLFVPGTIYRNQKPGNRVVEDILESFKYNEVTKVPINLLNSAIKLCTRSNFIYNREGLKRPAQNGLAYSWGAKDYTKRANPPGQKDTCSYEIYGLDCSGFIFTIFKETGIPFLEGPADAQRNVSVLKDALQKYLNSDHFDVKDLGALKPEQIHAGDIIYFYSMKKTKTGTFHKRAFHIGIALKMPPSDDIFFVASNGGPNNCDTNLKKGPTAVKLNKAFGGYSYSVVRIQWSLL